VWHATEVGRTHVRHVPDKDIPAQEWQGDCGGIKLQMIATPLLWAESYKPRILLAAGDFLEFFVLWCLH
jgi:hypothetical protein